MKTRDRKTMAKTRTILLGFPFVVGAAVAVAACGEDRRSGFGDGAEDRASNPGIISSEAGSSEPPEGDAGVCLSETLGAEPVPLAMLLLMDRSGSMSGTEPNKWTMARQAMISFADTPGAAGSKLGLSLFPPDPGAGDQCQPSSYAPIVPIALLPGNGTAIKDALVTRSTTGSTPMLNALTGSIDAMRSFLTANPNEEGVIILVTDGSPGGCTGDTVANVASVAQAAATGSPKIRTFVVGMEGATFSSLDTIAAAGGGSPKAFNASGSAVDGGVSPQQQLLDALDAIRSGALGCEYVVPTPEASKGSVDPNTVEIDFTAGKNDPPQKFRRVADESQCGATTGGFYYDDPKAPKRIILCPASCEAVRGGTAEAKVDVVLGCIKQVN